MKLKSLASTILALACAATAAMPGAAGAADTVDATDSSVFEICDSAICAFFCQSPIFSSIDYMVRLDMVDYYNSGQKKPMPTRTGGTATLDALSGEYLKVSTSDKCVIEAHAYTAKKGLVIAVARTVFLPAADSSLLFDCSWSYTPVEGIFEEPQMADFLKKEVGKKQRADVLSRVSFPLIRYSFLPNGDIEARPTVCDYMSREDSAAVAPCLVESIVYEWTGSKFRKKK